MTLEDIKTILSAQQQTLSQEYNVKSLSVFGSVARQEATESSDIDVLVDFNGAADFISFMNLKFYLEKLFGVSVDLVTRKALRSALKPIIEQDAIRVA